MLSLSVFVPASTTAVYKFVTAHAVKNIFLATVFMYVNGCNSSKDNMKREKSEEYFQKITEATDCSLRQVKKYTKPSVSEGYSVGRGNVGHLDFS